jgi:hypothetical protein
LQPLLSSSFANVLAICISIATRQEARWVPEPVWKIQKRDESLALLEIEHNSVNIECTA